MSFLETEATRVPEEGPPGEAASLARLVCRRLRRRPSAVAGAVLIGLFVGAAVLAPVLAPYGVSDGDLSQVRPGFVPGPSAHHPLGLDEQGRDQLSRLLHGARSSLVVGLASVSLGILVGGVVGTVAVMRGGWVDSVIMRVMDVMLAIPGLLFAIGLAALLGPSLPSVAVAIGAGGVPVVARLVRGSVLAELERDYVAAARALGAGPGRLAARHLLPNSVAPVLVVATLSVGAAILDAAGLAFLGLGPRDPGVPEWGDMLAEGQRLLQTSPHLVLVPGAAIVLAALGFNLLGEALREALDPRQGAGGGGGRRGEGRRVADRRSPRPVRQAGAGGEARG